MSKPKYEAELENQDNKRQLALDEAYEAGQIDIYEYDKQMSNQRYTSDPVCTGRGPWNKYPRKRFSSKKK